MKIKIILISAFILLCGMLKAQQEIQLYGKGGYSGLQYKSEQVAVKNKLSGGLGIGYTYFLNSKWGINTGLEVDFYSTDAESDGLAGRYTETYSDDTRTEEMYFNSSYTNYKETQHVTCLSIPIRIQYQLPVSETTTFYAVPGIKLGFAISGKYDLAAAKLTTWGEFPETLQQFYNMPEHGFTAINNVSSSDDLSFGLNLALSVETGLKWKLSDKLSLYTGLYIDYGLSDVSPGKKDVSLVNYNNNEPYKLKTNSLLTAKQGEKAYVDKVNLLSAGVTVKLAFGI
ncbi:MAG: PorT family protein [Prevotella sp.]|jgi:hypothetical protein|nr:PorT family protein [Prevotella sp.]